jgi:hypothetical protein
MYTHIGFMTCSLLVPIAYCSEISPVLLLPGNDLTNSAPPRAERIRKSAQDENGLSKFGVAVNDHGTQHQHPRNDRSETTSNIDTGTTPHPDEGPDRRSC